jgi:hypothetical protein
LASCTSVLFSVVDAAIGISGERNRMFDVRNAGRNWALSLLVVILLLVIMGFLQEGPY